MQLIFIGKWRHLRLDYRLAQANETVKDAQRGKADFLTGTDGCATRRTACKSPVNPGTLPSGIPEIAVIYSMRTISPAKSMIADLKSCLSIMKMSKQS